MVHIVWEFRIRPEQQQTFEQYYGGDGHWVKLFQHSSAFVATSCARDVEDPLRYLVTDMWNSLEAYQDFKQAYRIEYEQMDKICEAFTVEEKYWGTFQA